MTDDNSSKGGSYIRQSDGSLKLVDRTEIPERVFAADKESAEAQQAPETPAAAVEPQKKGAK